MHRRKAPNGHRSHFTIETAIQYLKERSLIADDYTVAQYRESVRTWSFQSHVFSRYFKSLGNETFTLLPQAKASS